MERGARREEARGLRARAAAAPRDPQPASAGARTGTRPADARARAAPAPPAGSGSRPGAEAPLAAPPPQSSRSARRSRSLGSSDSSRPAPRRSGERRIVMQRLSRGSGGEEREKSWGRRGRRSPGGKAEDTPTLRPLLPPSPHSDRPEGPHGPGLSLTGRGTASHGLAAAPHAAPAGRQRGPGGGGTPGRSGGAFPAGERASARGGGGGRTCSLLPSSPPSCPPHAGSIATNMAAAQSPGGGREAAPESSREPRGAGAVLSFLLVRHVSVKGRGQDRECSWRSDWLGLPWLKAAVSTDWSAEPSLTPAAVRWAGRPSAALRASASFLPLSARPGRGGALLRDPCARGSRRLLFWPAPFRGKNEPQWRCINVVTLRLGHMATQPHPANVPEGHYCL